MSESRSLARLKKTIDPTVEEEVPDGKVGP
jgi:hypothetical protein